MPDKSPPADLGGDATKASVGSNNPSHRSGSARERGNRHRKHGAVVKLIVNLERLAKSGVPAQRRIDLLRGLEARVITVLFSLPKSVATTRQSGQAAGISVEQRIYGLMVKNLKLALIDLDRSEVAFSRGASEDLWWLVRHLFLFLGRSIEYSVRADRPWVPGIWSELHDIFFYLVTRRDVSVGGESASNDLTFDSETEYKRLLLLGLIGQLVAAADRTPQLLRLLTIWAKETRLKGLATYDGALNVYVVEVAKDMPASKCSGDIEYGFNGWVLEPTQAFHDHLAGLSRNAF